MDGLTKAIVMAVGGWPLAVFAVHSTSFDEYSGEYHFDPVLVSISTSVVYALVMTTIIATVHHMWDLNATDDDPFS